VIAGHANSAPNPLRGSCFKIEILGLKQMAGWSTFAAIWSQADPYRRSGDQG
jgi:hypothetical protein